MIKNDDFVNLEFSYGVKSDNELSVKGFKFLGTGKDEKGQEVHVFQKEPLGKFHKRMKKIEICSRKYHQDIL